MKRTSFSELAYEHKKKTTRKERFLAEIEAILPGGIIIKPKNPKKYAHPSANWDLVESVEAILQIDKLHSDARQVPHMSLYW